MSRFPRDTEEFDRKLQVQIGERIRAAREDRGISVSSLSTKLGISTSTLYEIERGATACSMRNLYWICEHLSLSASYFLEGDRAMDCDCPELDEELKKLDYGEKKRIAGVIRAFYGGRPQKYLQR